MASTLNKKQKIAVLHDKGPMMVLAGPGSGKTMVITHRVANLINRCNVVPQDILVITFTKAAADEMKHRFLLLSKKKNINGKSVSFGTFHAIFFRILRSTCGYTLENVLKEDQKRLLLKQIVNHRGIEYEDEQEFIEELIREISFMKNELIGPKYYHSMCCSTEDFRYVFEQYEKYKEEKGYIDFDDMLCKCYETLYSNQKVLNFWQRKFRYILVDEFQDINRVQYEIIKLLAKPDNNLFVVGDDDQSIYKFRGARPEFLLHFPEDFPTAQSVVLDINYRSTPQIINASNRLIKNNQQRYKKNIQAFKESGVQPILLESEDSEQEALLIARMISEQKQKGIPYEEMAVIFRTNIQARALVDVFLDLHLPFYLRDESPTIYDHWITKDMIAYCILAMDRKQDQQLERIINKPKRYISKDVLAEAKRKPGNLINTLYQVSNLQNWQVNRLEELQFHLQSLQNKPPHEAIKYIRNIIGYNEFLLEYADYRKIGVKGLKEILDEVQEGAKHYPTFEEWIAHIQDVNIEMKEHRKVKDKPTDAITLTTMHGAKGLEFQLVCIAGAVEGVIPHDKSKGPSELEEERRLFYVGMTRAKEVLYISKIKNRYEEQVEPTRFIREMNQSVTLNDLDVGTKIHHAKYGEGIIKDIEVNLAQVKFEKHWMLKKIDLKHCIEANLIK